jgi:dsDNA-specific endonuclease/ATPase MutS2
MTELKLTSVNDDIESKIRDFSDLLSQIETLTDKKKKLWQEIYENAVTDRSNAYVMFQELYEIVKNKSTEHAVHARSMTSYLERMAKCNDQLIKLAELIAAAEQKSEAIDPNDVYDQIMGKKN